MVAELVERLCSNVNKHIIKKDVDSKNGLVKPEAVILYGRF